MIIFEMVIEGYMGVNYQIHQIYVIFLFYATLYKSKALKHYFIIFIKIIWWNLLSRKIC